MNKNMNRVNEEDKYDTDNKKLRQTQIDKHKATQIFFIHDNAQYNIYRTTIVRKQTHKQTY